ncbi:hypothetical protein DE146DRAFT_765819 [Phaeosphaeria sp. MPI-PUGE-AT-0046c]|nr:hypothetical protein DE146DRAFT_765819 [Phaeosphaeria sp. MPI-PUGE-AT-0046c]
MVALLLFLVLLPIAFSIPGLVAADENSLIVLDNGVGHRSLTETAPYVPLPLSSNYPLTVNSTYPTNNITSPAPAKNSHLIHYFLQSPIPRWRTSLRSISTSGRNAHIFTQYGPVPPNNYTTVEPINAYALGYSNSTSSLYLGTGSGLLRTDLNGTNARTVSNASDVASIYVSEKTEKVYYGTSHDGLIRRSNLDGTSVEIFRNVSQGIEFGQARRSPSGIVVDEDEGWVYWSASNGEDDGSIRRVKLNGDEEQVLAEGLNMPGQLRINSGMLYWCEKGRWLNSPTSLSRARLPLSASNSTVRGMRESEIVVHSNHTAIFFEYDSVEKQTLGITSFVFNEDADRLWFVMESSNRVIFSKMVEVRLPSKALKLMNWEAEDLGVPMGIEYVQKERR